MSGVIVCEFGTWQESIPIVLFPIAVGSDVGFYYSVHSFCLAIYLGSMGVSGGLFDVEVLAEVFPEPIYPSSVSVGYNGGRYAMVAYNGFYE